MSTPPIAWRPPTDEELDDILARMDRIDALESAGVHHAEAPLLQ